MVAYRMPQAWARPQMLSSLKPLCVKRRRTAPPESNSLDWMIPPSARQWISSTRLVWQAAHSANAASPLRRAAHCSKGVACREFMLLNAPPTSDASSASRPSGIRPSAGSNCAASERAAVIASSPVSVSCARISPSAAP